MDTPVQVPAAGQSMENGRSRDSWRIRMTTPRMVAACLTLLGCTCLAHAQTQQGRPKPAAKPHNKPAMVDPAPATEQPAKDATALPPASGTIRFGDTPLKLETVGLTMQVPLDAEMHTDVAGTSAAAQVTPKDHTWMLNIATPRTSQPDYTAAKAVDAIVTEIFSRIGEVYDPDDPSKLVALKGKLVQPRHTV